MTPHGRLIEALREHALVLGEVTLTSGLKAQYYVDAKRAILLPDGFSALGELLAERAREWEATAVGGMTMGADAVSCAALAGGRGVRRGVAGDAVLGVLRGAADVLEGEQREADRHEQAEHDGEQTQRTFEHGF